MGDSGDNGVTPSDVDPSLPDNTAELEAAKDAAKESKGEACYNDARASKGANSLWESIFGKK